MLKDYQRAGVDWMKQRDGCILGDEQGLGKTIQAIYYIQETKKKSLVISPLSVLDNWRQEFEVFAPSIDVVVYAGAYRKDQVCLLDGADVILTSYEMVYELIDLNIAVVIVDEGHRLKNLQSKIHQFLVQEFGKATRIILTGTPVQNNLDELQALVDFVKPGFKGDLQDILLRRTKYQVLNLPNVKQVVLQTGLTAIQKKLYLAILQQDAHKLMDAKQSNINTLMQLRKCISHPYLFRGVEPEPFTTGDHLWLASGKMRVLHDLLQYLKSKGHSVLIFCQFKGVLDILQDYMDLQQLSYERLDGSIRGQDRFDTLERYKKDAAFVFLLSTRAGGVGLNLVQADTVIFYDIDHNPQMDLQAAARAHRIGQIKEVQVITLLSRSTCDEVIYRRGRQKLKLARGVLGDSIDEDIQLLAGVEQIMETRDVDDHDDINFEQLLASNIYEFEGQDYKVNRKSILDKLVDDVNDSGQDQLEVIRKKRKLESQKLQQERLKKLWEDNNYTSAVLEPITVEQNKDAEIIYVTGDASQPQVKPAVILHAVDNSGRWSTRGFFAALDRLSLEIGQQYRKSHQMKDLKLGQVHMINVGEDLIVALMVCMKTGDFNVDALQNCLSALSQLDTTLHMPRFNSQTSSWYSLERYFKKYLSQRCYVYYFNKQQAVK